MSKSIFGGAHSQFVETIVAARKRSGLTQAQVAARLGKDQTYVSLIERSQRRVDVLEFIALARAMGAEPDRLFAEVLRKVPKSFGV
jgi:transcriptional regulator with XRE-family HTH domain